MDARDRSIVRLAIPAVATLAVQPLYVLVDTAIVGHLGTTALGGVALASTVLTTTFFVVTVLEYGITARVAFLSGRHDRRAAAGVAVDGLWLSIAVAVVLAAVIGLGGRTLASLLGGEGDVLDAATTYLHISAVAAPFTLFALVGVGYLRGVQDTRTPLLVVLVANVINVILEVTFVYGLDWGVAGSAWSTVVAEVVAAGWFVAVIAARVRATGASVRPHRTGVRGLVKSGGHLSVRTGALLGTLALSTSVAARLGPATLGGHQIALQIETFLALAVDSLAIAGQALVGTALGAGDAEEARLVGHRLIRWGIYAGLVLLVVVVATSGLIPHVFSSDPAVQDRATVALVFVGIIQLPAAVVFVLDGVLLGAGDDAFQGWSNVAAFAAFLPFVVIVLHWKSLGIAGVWTGLLVWMTARLVANATRFAGSHWTKSTVSF